MTVMSVRFKNQATPERLKRLAKLTGESMSAAAERLIEEGIRMADHPGVFFQDGATGRRPRMWPGPDVRQVVRDFHSVGGDVEARIAEVADMLTMDLHQVRAALRYYAEFTQEIDDVLAEEDRFGEEAYAAWKREQQLLAK